VIIADFNGDGKPDLAAPTENNTVSVLLNKGSGKFGAAVDYAVGFNPLDAVVGDFNGDGRLDLAVVDQGSNAISVLLGNGDGTFQPRVQYAAGVEPQWIAVGDFNGDGKLDLATDDYYTSNAAVLLGNGDGTFQPFATFPSGHDPSRVATGDFNGDGKLDLAITLYSNTVSILLGNGDGTFQLPVTYSVGNIAAGLVVGDFNNDGRADIAVANDEDNTVSILLSNGDGTFQSQLVYPTGNVPVSLTLADFNGDGNLDLAVANILSFDAPWPPGTVSLLLGNGDGTFQPRVDYLFGEFPYGPAAADLNGDGGADLALGSGFPVGAVSVLLNLPVISVFPNALNFGTEKVGVKSSPLTIAISNPSGTPITISGKPKINGADATDFTETTTCALKLSTLAAGAQCSISVTFDPKATGSRNATLTLKDTVPGSPQAIALGGIGK
jgi:hypothetical protein